MSRWIIRPPWLVEALSFSLFALCTPAQAACPTDLDGSGSVDLGDVAFALMEFGGCPSAAACAADVDGTGTVDLADIALVLLDFGPCPAWYTVLEQVPNSSVVWDASLRNAITATGKPWRVRDNGTGIEMVLIPPGTFTMGCSPSNAFGCSLVETPTHQVTFTKAWYLSRTEVTQADWVANMNSNPSQFAGDSTLPVQRVSWADLNTFCLKTGMRLPTEAEWEYAYRAGASTAFHGMPGFLDGTNDDYQLELVAWVSWNSGGQPHPVAGKAPNGFGLFDMAGNVFEVCEDLYGYYSADAQTDPTGPPSASSRVTRGGSFDSLSSQWHRASARQGRGVLLLGVDSRTGFRVARNP